MTEQIEKRIKMMGLKKSYVAKYIGASSSEFSHFLSGRRDLNETKLVNLKKYLGIN